MLAERFDLVTAGLERWPDLEQVMVMISHLKFTATGQLRLT
jgi:hypothetical protein